jgi:hypothetical protein
MMEVIGSAEMSVLTKATQCHIPEDCILHSHNRENHVSCMFNSYLKRTIYLRQYNVHVHCINHYHSVTAHSGNNRVTLVRVHVVCDVPVQTQWRIVRVRNRVYGFNFRKGPMI